LIFCFVQIVYELPVAIFKKAVRDFLEGKNELPEEISLLCDHIWLFNLAFLVDIANQNCRARTNCFLHLVNKITAFKMKLKLFISQLDDANMNPFPHLKEQIEGAVHNGNLRKCTTKIKSLPDSIESRFYNFAESGTRLENKFNIENEIQGCHIGEFIARFQKSGEF